MIDVDTHALDYWYPGKILTPFDRLYVPDILSRVSFPHRDPGSVTYLATDNKYIFSIEAGYKYVKNEDRLESYGIPYGIYPRLILILITSYAVHNKERKIKLSDTLTEFLRSLGYSTTGGDHGTIAQLHNQVERLLNCRICIRKYDENSSEKRYLHPVDSIEVWESQNAAISEKKTEISATISESFYTRINDTAFPVWPETVENLRSSLLALDLYFFLTSRCFRLKGRNAYIKWSSLKKQIGSGYSLQSEFTRHSKKAIAEIQRFYPKLNVKYKRGRLILLASSKPDVQ